MAFTEQGVSFVAWVVLVGLGWPRFEARHVSSTSSEQPLALKENKIKIKAMLCAGLLAQLLCRFSVDVNFVTFCYN